MNSIDVSFTSKVICKLRKLAFRGIGITVCLSSIVPYFRKYVKFVASQASVKVYEENKPIQTQFCG